MIDIEEYVYTNRNVFKHYISLGNDYCKEYGVITYPSLLAPIIIEGERSEVSVPVEYLTVADGYVHNHPSLNCHSHDMINDYERFVYNKAASNLSFTDVQSYAILITRKHINIPVWGMVYKDNNKYMLQYMDRAAISEYKMSFDKLEKDINTAFRLNNIPLKIAYMGDYYDLLQQVTHRIQIP